MDHRGNIFFCLRKIFSDLCAMWSNNKHFNLPRSYEFRNLELGDKELKIKSPETKWK